MSMIMIFPYLVLVRNPRWLQEDEQSDQSPHSDSEQSTVSSPCRIDTVNFISLVFMDKIDKQLGFFITSSGAVKDDCWGMSTCPF